MYNYIHKIHIERAIFQDKSYPGFCSCCGGAPPKKRDNFVLYEIVIVFEVHVKYSYRN